MYFIITYISLQNTQLINIFEKKVLQVNFDTGYHIHIICFTYTVLVFVSIIVLELVLTVKRLSRYTGAGDIRRVYIPVVPPMVLVIMYSAGTTISCLVEHELAPYFAFVFFTFFRSSLFTVAVAFVGDA